MLRTALAIVAVVLLAHRAAAAPPPIETEAVRTGRFADDLYVAGRSVTVDGEVAGDLVAAGRELTLGRRVRADVLAAGGRVTIDGEVGDDVRAAGGELTLSGRLGGDLIAAGGTVTVSPETRVTGRSRVAGGRVDIGGRHERGIEIYGGHVRFSGETPGNVEVVADALEVLPGARIGGTLYHATRGEPRIDPAADLAAVEAMPPADWRVEAMRRIEAWRASGGEVLGIVGPLSRLVFWLSLLVTGAVALAALPRGMLAAARTVASDPGKSLGLGFITLVVAPVLALVLLLTVVGAWLGLAIFALYPIALLGGLVVGIAWLGDLVARAVSGPDPSRLAEVAGYAVAVLLAALAGLVPVLGGWVLFLAVVVGLGAIVVALWRLTVSGRAGAPVGVS